MANKTINGITTELESVANADLFPVWDASEGVTAKVTKSTLLDGMQEELTFDEEPTDSSTNPVTSGGVFSANAVITASSTTLEGVTISSGSVIRVMFTSAITGSDTSTALSLTYNDTAYSVKVGKQGSLANFVASYVNSTYTYLQAYTTLELAFDGTQFIIIGNPVVLSSSDYTIYADGQFNRECVVFKGNISYDGYDTGLSIDGGSYGRTYIIIGSCHTSSGDATNSGVYMVRCGYNGGNYSVVTIAESINREAAALTISISSDNTLVLTATVGWAVTILSNKL